MLTPLEKIDLHEALTFHFYRLPFLDMKSVFDFPLGCIANLYFA